MKINTAIFLFFILLIAIAGWTIVKINSDSGKCLVNPIKYGIDKMAAGYKTSVMCGCTVKGYQPIYFTSNFTKYLS